MNIELFPCSGGMSEGFRRAGIAFDLCFDLDENACASHETNLGTRPIQCNVQDLPRLLQHMHLREPVDLLVADPPCTPWSRAGSRNGTADDRDCLEVTCDLIRELQPTAWLIANVPGLDDATNWRTVQDLIGALAEAGYCVDFQRLDAADYGVPQRRIRPFWFGHPRLAQCLSWPRPTHGDPANLATLTLPGVEELRPWVTCREALGHLPFEGIGRPIQIKRDKYRGHPPSDPHAPSNTIVAGPSRDGKNTMSLNPKHPPSEPDAPAHTISTGGTRHQGNTVVDWRARESHIDGPSRSVIPPPGHHAGNSYMSRGVALSETAAAILQGFPESWHFAGDTKKARWSQIGQAMPPPLAAAVARSIAEWARRHNVELAA